MTAAEACMKDGRLKACANLDGVVSAVPAYPDGSGRGPRQPFLFIEKPLATLRAEKPEDSNRRITLLRERGNAVLASVVSGRSYRITIEGATHATFSDEEIISSDNASRPRQLLDVTRAYVRAFFDQVFTGKENALFSSPPPASVSQIETFTPR